MRLKLLGLMACTLATLPPSASALQMKKKAVPNGGIFGIEVANTDLSFYGRADHIVSVSFQEYTTGALIVDEVVIDMQNSNQQLRIYTARPPGSADVADRANRASVANSQNRGLDPSAASKLPIPGPLSAIESKVNNLTQSSTAGLVVKTYPATTHAKTVEMVVSSKDELLKFYTAFRTLFSGATVAAAAGSSVDGSDAANTAAAAQGGTANVTINQIGGTVFVIE
jgi:hypothetical protein